MDRLLLLLSLLREGSLQQDPWYQLQVQESVTVQEGLCVLVSCTVSYPSLGRTDSTPIYGEWFRKGERPSQMDLPMATNNPGRGVKKKRKIPFHLLGDPGANNCSLGITDAKKGDSGNYYFQLMRGDVRHSYKNNLLIVNVTELTQTPDIYIKEPLESGSSSHVTCSVPGACDRATPPTISWTGAALRPPGLDSKGAYNSSEILLSPGPQDHGTNLTCRVTFRRAGVSTERTVRLDVSYAPQNLTVSIFRGNGTELKYLGNGSSLSVLEGESLRLACVTDSNPPATLSWSQGSRTLSPARPSNPGVLQVPRVELGHEGEFTCRAQHPQGSLWTSVHLSVQSPPQLLGPSCSQENEGLHCSCSSRARPAPSLRWGLGAGLLEGNFSNASFKVTSSSAGPWANSSLSLSEGLSPGLRLSCEAQNVHGAHSATVLLLPGKPKLGGEFVLGAVGGAGIAALLSLCSCLIFFTVKTFGKARGEKEEPPMPGPTSQGYQHECPPGSPLDLPPPVVAAPTSGEEQELHYASLSFYTLRPWEPQDQEAASTTEYTEIKIHK
ncbi:sialic acid-binding Ig-like lectin 11 isoform X1 [Kogia breviceps]|uniref:sialic acid-binding Ig-like lectin 11 isoform X1 n=1 Tax=Kogia breviceps TaxID=27615 RepID=UPI0034D3736F